MSRVNERPGLVDRPTNWPAVARGGRSFAWWSKCTFGRYSSATVIRFGGKGLASLARRRRAFRGRWNPRSNEKPGDGRVGSLLRPDTFTGREHSPSYAGHFLRSIDAQWKARAWACTRVSTSLWSVILGAPWPAVVPKRSSSGASKRKIR